VISRLLFSADFQTNFEKYLVCRKLIFEIKAFNDYLNSDLYQQSVVKVISTYTKSASFGVESQIMTSVMFNIQKNLLQSLASGTQCEPLSEIKTISENICLLVTLVSVLGNTDCDISFTFLS
jgi:hypothetical protein